MSDRIHKIVVRSGDNVVCYDKDGVFVIGFNFRQPSHRAGLDYWWDYASNNFERHRGESLGETIYLRPTLGSYESDRSDNENQAP